MSMHDARYEDRVEQLAKVIAPHVQFDNVDQAREYVQSYKQPESAEVPRAILKMAEHLHDYAERFNIERFINRRVQYRTTISMISEAIRLCAQHEVNKYELKELADIGSFDRHAMAVSA